MKAVGLITEYNPLHNGHIYHMNQALKMTGADLTIAVMSGNYVQRGEPAITDKYTRCRAALKSGINLLVELPVYYSLSSAEIFAKGAMRILNSLMCDYVVFGSECGDINALKEIANVLSNEPESFKNALKNELSSCLSFPKARMNALNSYFKNDYSKILENPNNILGIEYLKAIFQSKSAITPMTVKRIGKGYNDETIDSASDNSDLSFNSATAIRKAVSDNNTNIKELFLPQMYEEFIDSYNKSAPVFKDDFSILLNYRLYDIFFKCGNDKHKISSELQKYEDITENIANRIAVCFTGNDTFTEFAAKLKTKSYTLSRINRCLFHIILGIDHNTALFFAHNNYIRILGFDEKGREYLNEIKKKTDATIITKTSKHSELIAADIHAANIYNQICFNKFGYMCKDEFRHGICIKNTR